MMNMHSACTASGTDLRGSVVTGYWEVVLRPKIQDVIFCVRDIDSAYRLLLGIEICRCSLLMECIVLEFMIRKKH